MSLLRDIQDAAVDGSSDLETLLRKCRILASRLQNEDFKFWVQSELDGYKNDRLVPDYRKFQGNPYGNFSGFAGRQLKNALIPESCIPKKYRDQLTAIELREGVGSLIDLVKDCNTGSIQKIWPADAYRLFGHQIYENMHLLQAWIPIPKNLLVGILSTVRNRILNFALEIESSNPDAGEAALNQRPIPEERVSQIVNNYIFGTVGSVASGYDINQTNQQTIHAGNFESLANFLRNTGFNDTDIIDLGGILKTEQPPQKGGFGPKVKEWLTRVAEGAVNLSTSIAINILTDALKRFYGI